MSEAIGSDATAAHVADVDPATLGGLNVLIVGSPTQGGRPTKPVAALLDAIPANALQQTRAAAFDTRFAAADHGFGLRILMKVIGFAAPRIASKLRAKGGRMAAPPEGFIVRDREGPLKDGELERAAAWARGLAGLAD
jgi:hypothetical protein